MRKVVRVKCSVWMLDLDEFLFLGLGNVSEYNIR